ncbi:hypothetical protein EDB81DRAFT_784019 [Dactylonectria macrodidyma]|uniref:Secreted protein n=1 Tax=Dactylonectria macrodidyma TaxID=307937 RepID=A0A9P9JH18_9HYPO|nr:hypothetical protein EDB81DRAFT_784019 [Dactylonectria macrodidyma]
MRPPSFRLGAMLPVLPLRHAVLFGPHCSASPSQLRRDFHQASSHFAVPFPTATSRPCQSNHTLVLMTLSSLCLVPWLPLGVGSSCVHGGLSQERRPKSDVKVPCIGTCLREHRKMEQRHRIELHFEFGRHRPRAAVMCPVRPLAAFFGRLGRSVVFHRPHALMMTGLSCHWRDGILAWVLTSWGQAY